ncbi:MAG: hypothetical protein FWF34_00550 [Alphaproteobacteria bacterium]|nr:hypothetical protein [Alphaproteobacteria bacterium]MCL2889737.1 hypothetical protein [Alphaproteobacteria bacterium]
MTFKEFIEIIAALLTIFISLIALYGIFIAHKRGFFKAFRNISESYHDIIEHIKIDGKKKKPKNNA